MTQFHQCTVRRLSRLGTVIWALNTVPAPAGHCCPALLPTYIIAGTGIRTPAAAERAPWIRICRLGAAKLHFAQQAGGYDKKRDGQHAHHISLPVVFWFASKLTGSAGGAEWPPRRGLQSRSSPRASRHAA